MWRFLLATADPERRAALTVLVVMRWALIAAALFQVNYRPGTEPGGFALLNSLIMFAAVLNGVLQWRLLRPRAIPNWFPVAVGFYDVVAVTGAIASVDGFDNPSFLLYYPAVLSFVLVFPGKWSIVYTVAVMLAYSASITLGPDGFDEDSTGDQKALIMRLLTLATAGLMANLVVRVERTRRLAAVEAGARAAEERFAAEQRALQAEREVESERRRLSQEIHDGVSQRVYMLSLGLENARVSAERDGAPALAARLETLHQVSLETLLETRNLLFDLGRVMAGQSTIDELARNLATEFSAVTGVAVEVRAAAAQAPMDPASVGELFRIIQEALANVMKHAGATNVVIALETSGGALQVTVTDNGSGFEADAARMGHGLNNIRERAARLRGAATIESSPGAGTTVRVSLPLAEEAPS